MRRDLSVGAAVLVLASLAAFGGVPVDCLPDAVALWQAAGPAPDTRFGAANLPGIVLGPPGSSGPTDGSTTVASLGASGVVVLRFDDIAIEDRPGPDFIVFENAFFVGSVPTSDADDFTVFDEPGIVEVSLDGQEWRRFPFDATALAAVAGRSVNRQEQRSLQGLAGITPTFSGNWTVADDLQLWDSSGTGGVSGAGGDAFDLAAVGLAQARFVRITDAGTHNGPSGSAEGFDLDAVVALHARPRAALGVDTDADRLSDAAETAIYGSDPVRADSDGDGTDDGREVAGCRNPSSPDGSAWFVAEPRIWVRPGSCSELRWTFLGNTVLVDLLRGRVRELLRVGSHVDLGLTTCLRDNASGVRFACDATLPVVGDSFFYLVRRVGDLPYGWSRDWLPRQALAGCP